MLVLFVEWTLRFWERRALSLDRPFLRLSGAGDGRDAGDGLAGVGGGEFLARGRLDLQLLHAHVQPAQYNVPVHP